MAVVDNVKLDKSLRVGVTPGVPSLNKVVFVDGAGTQLMLNINIKTHKQESNIEIAARGKRRANEIFYSFQIGHYAYLLSVLT